MIDSHVLQFVDWKNVVFPLVGNAASPSTTLAQIQKLGVLARLLRTIIDDDVDRSRIKPHVHKHPSQRDVYWAK